MIQVSSKVRDWLKREVRYNNLDIFIVHFDLQPSAPLGLKIELNRVIGDMLWGFNGRGSDEIS